jgi:predicted pyridoxine 5'-phosphate oxidase superfamily flavin-nucleotide-binding protein
MGNRFAEIAFTSAVKAAQTANHSREAMAAMETGPDGGGRLGEDEVGMISTRDSFYLASVSETGWPYVQHKGGPPGFLRVLDDRTIGFADFRGNRQYLSVGNVSGEGRVCLFLIDYPSRLRLKILGRARLTGDPDEIEPLKAQGCRAVVERGWIVAVEAFDWNCAQHITRRFSAQDVMQVIAPLQQKVAELESELARLRDAQSGA